MGKFINKIVLITGAAGDLGKTLTKDFLAESAKVVAVDNNATQLSMLKEECRHSESLLTKQADVTQSADMQSIVESTVQAFGGLDIAIFNAGIVGAISPIESYPEELFDKVMAVNVRGVWLGIKHTGPALRRRGGGSIVIMSSVAGLIGDPNTSAYIASKHAVLASVGARPKSWLRIRYELTVSIQGSWILVWCVNLMITRKMKLLTMCP